MLIKFQVMEACALSRVFPAPGNPNDDKLEAAAPAGTSEEQ